MLPALLVLAVVAAPVPDVTTQPLPSFHAARATTPVERAAPVLPDEEVDVQDLGGPAEYLIVTSQALAPAFQRFAAWKRQHGTTTTIRTLGSIRAQFPDAFDDAERIRNCIRAAHASGTRWVLLGGDTEVVPTRMVRANFFSPPQDFPSDLYFACLDGTWNADGDAYFGEDRYGEGPGDDVDLVPEVFVGRAPVRTKEEVRHFVDKTLDYAEGRAVPRSRQTLFLAEVLLPENWRPGDHPSIDLAMYANHFLRFPPGSALDAVRLYQNHADPSYVPGAFPENAASALEHLSRGYPLTVFLGNGSPTQMSVGPDLLDIDDVLALDNRQALTHLFQALGCLGNDITQDCIGEAFLRAPGGAVTNLGPSTAMFVGQSAVLMAEYFRVWLAGEASTIGELSARYRQRAAGQLYQQSMILLGDPELPIVPPTPAARGRGHLPAQAARAASENVAMLAAWPNPARERVSVAFDLPEGARGGALEIAIYDLHGRRVRRLANGGAPSSRFEASWDLRDDAGRRVGEGVYFVSARVGGKVQVQRLLVVR